MRVLIDGRPTDPATAGLSVFDWTVLRGDGCFEALRSYGGRPFAVDAHLDRLEGSVAGLGLSLPDRADLGAWIRQVAEDGGDCVVRLLVTRGGADPLVEAPSRVVVLWEPLPDLPAALRLLPVAAPWHAAGIPWELSGVKSLSYAPNVAAQRSALAAGFDDALLVGREDEVLEGPTSSVAWFVGGVLEAPTLELGVLASITRAVAFEEAARLGMEVREARFTLERLREADEVLALSTIKEVRPVAAVGDWTYEAGPLTAKVAAAFRDRIEEETS